MLQVAAGTVLQDVPGHRDFGVESRGLHTMLQVVAGTAVHNVPDLGVEQQFCLGSVPTAVLHTTGLSDCRAALVGLTGLWPIGLLVRVSVPTVSAGGVGCNT